MSPFLSSASSSFINSSVLFFLRLILHTPQPKLEGQMYYLGSFPNSLTPWHQWLQHSHCQHWVLCPAKPSSWRERINKTRHSAAAVGLFGHNKQLKEPQSSCQHWSQPASQYQLLWWSFLNICRSFTTKLEKRTDEATRNQQSERRVAARLRLQF